LGPHDVGERNRDNKRFWEKEASVVIGVVEKVERPAKPWVVMDVRLIAKVSGQIDLATTPKIRVASLGESNPFALIPEASTRVLLIVVAFPRDVPLDHLDASEVDADYLLPYVVVRDKKTIGALVPLSADDDGPVEPLLARIQYVRSAQD
jgi:hypothetical protein